MLYNAKLAQTFSKDLYEEGVFCSGILLPSSALQGKPEFETQISAALDFEMLEKSQRCFCEGWEKAQYF